MRSRRIPPARALRQPRRLSTRAQRATMLPAVSAPSDAAPSAMAGPGGTCPEAARPGRPAAAPAPACGRAGNAARRLAGNLRRPAQHRPPPGGGAGRRTIPQRERSPLRPCYPRRPSLRPLGWPGCRRPRSRQGAGDDGKPKKCRRRRTAAGAGLSNGRELGSGAGKDGAVAGPARNPARDVRRPSGSLPPKPLQPANGAPRSTGPRPWQRSAALRLTCADSHRSRDNKQRRSTRAHDKFRGPGASQSGAPGEDASLAR